MIVSMDFEDDVFYIQPPGPNSDRFRIVKRDIDNPPDFPHMKDRFHTREQATLNMLRLNIEGANSIDDKKFFKELYDKHADMYPEYVI